MPTTTNFGWTTPADTDLVKNGALAIRTLGNGIDTSMAELKGGTTGQILSKTSNTDMDFTWINNDQGDITAVTAGTGLTGGGTTGAVTLTNDMATAIDAKGDLIAGTGSDAYARLAVGANNTVLTADSTTATGLKWAAASGKLIQVVSATTTTATTISSTTFTDTGLTVSITPTATTSKILVLLSQHFFWDRTGTEATVKLQLLRGATQIYDLDSSSMFGNYVAGTTQVQGRNNIGISYLDSPSSTSSLTYKTQGRIATSSTSTFNNGSTSSIVLMEIGA